jgi:anaerobic selenocysteine-containing dehydrogenase
MAILALPAVAGKFGVRGGGYMMSNSASWGITRPWIAAEEPATREVNMNRLGRTLLEASDPPVKVLFVYNNNAAVTSPDQRRVLQGLEREDLFTVVFEQVMTDTARYADVLLPATTFLEAYDIARGYGPISLQLGKPVVEAQGEARSNAEVFGELMSRLDVRSESDPSGELEEMLNVLAQLPDPIGSDLRDSGCATPPHSGRPIQFKDVWPLTPDGKADLFPERLDAAAPLGLYGYQPDPATADFPLALISMRPRVAWWKATRSGSSTRWGKFAAPSHLVRGFEPARCHCPRDCGAGIHRTATRRMPSCRTRSPILVAARASTTLGCRSRRRPRLSS